MKKTHVLAFSWEQGRGSRIKLPGTLAGFHDLGTLDHTECPLWSLWLCCCSTLGQRLPGPMREHGWVARNSLDPAQLPNRVRVVITGIRGGITSETVWISNWCANTVSPWTPDLTGCLSWPLSFQCCSSLGWKCYCSEEEECTLRGNGTHLDPTIRFLLQNTKTWTHLSRAVLASECRRSLGSHLVPALAPPSPFPSLTNVRAANSPSWETWVLIMSDTDLPPKPLGIRRLHRNAPTKGHSFETRVGNYFT